MNKRYLPPAVYGGALLAVLLPLLAPGFILTVDMIFTPNLRMPALSDDAYLFFVLLHWLNAIVPSDVLQKIVLAAILFLSGVGAHMLFMAIAPKKAPLSWQWAAYVAGIAYMINPFVYSRFMAGQFLVLLGYALLPFFARFAWQFALTPTWPPILKLTGVAIVIGAVSIHSIGFMAIIAVAMGIMAIVRHWHHKEAIRHMLLRAPVAVIIFVVASSYWLVPLLQGDSAVATTLSGIGQADREAFATAGGNFLLQLGNVLQLQGFWQERTDLFILPQARMPLWGLLLLMWWGIVVCGLVYLWRHARAVAVVFGGVGLVGTILATGAGQSALSDLIPLWAGYREPQKFAALTAVSFAVLGGAGVVAIAERIRRYKPEYTSMALLAGGVLPLLLAPIMLGGFGGQLRPVQYPADWTMIDAHLASDHTEFQALFLPWHLYMYFEFAGRLIANPAPKFFATPVIVSSNPEVGQLTTPINDNLHRTLDGILQQGPTDKAFAATLAQNNIKYIMVAKEQEYQQYDYLRQHTDLVVAQDTPSLIVYRNLLFKENTQ